VEEGNAPSQIDIDLSEFSRSAAPRQESACPEEQVILLNTQGVIAFYASQGIERYTVSVNQDLREKKLTLLDSQKALPEGDVFAVTLVRPGAYRVEDVARKGEKQLQRGDTTIHPAVGQIQVSPPPRENYRADQITLVERTREGFKPREVSIYSGQSVAFLCRVPAQIRVEPVQPAPGQAGEPAEKRRKRITRTKPKQAGA
jgi:hypothetical protein